MKRLTALAVILATALIAGNLSAQAIKEFRISAIPDENPQEMLRIYQPFADYLTKEIGIRVKFTPVVDYAATVEGLAANRLEMVWYGGLTSVQAARQAKGARRIIMRKEDAEFKSHFITRKETGIKALKDLKGKTFAFGSVSSTSGHLMPRYFLLKGGINPEKDFSRFSFSGAHDATAAWVEAGQVEAGALNFLVWDKLVETKKVDTNKVGIFWTTPPYVDYVWTVRAGVDKGTVDKITKAFLRLDYTNAEHKKLLDLHRTKGYIAAKDEDWKAIEEAAVAAGLIKLN
ncbi:MAG: putative selenate ABC transporter substrate-binding protein [Deltaproteobacteria bacterium]|nr:putative selenate ABC transporter substrate-binding protein [Deltaproteobacteria bacterium]MBI2181440.1 putative selenate ABC transporter substrate-binding protein [Deltaproteobacteria bacterium]MBI2229639.1 putative selenate ABC transporter substrate-binding protein [Deltaproteobacteria bacterium]MBI2366161.1 putative selenate ABC transporter substrate-binding protein [Deltaproteobacteria bacterium]